MIKKTLRYSQYNVRKIYTKIVNKPQNMHAHAKP